ncbi:MAG: alkaline phosphatase family protein, partial [bacterium]
LHRQQSGLIVGVFDTIDRIQHLFWRYRDPKHPLYDEDPGSRAKQAIPNVYRKMDEILGEVMNSVSDETPILIVSDHGFTTFRRQFHVND